MNDEQKLNHSDAGWPCRVKETGELGTALKTIWKNMPWFVSSEGSGEGPTRMDEIEFL